MNKLTLKNSRHIDLCMDDVVYRNDNLITTIFIIFPDKIDEYPRKDCNVELRAILPNGDYLPYNIPTAEGKTSFLITNDLTEAAQVVKLMMIITHNGNVIGSTNEQEINVKEPTKTLEPLTPRAEFDRVIAAQRAEIAEQAETITTQGETITQQGERITELSGEVTELTTENTRLENLTETQRQTIQYTIDHPPQPRLYTPPVVTPSVSIQQINPPTGYDGLNECTVDRITAEVDSDIQPQNIKAGVNILGVDGTYKPLGGEGGYYINGELSDYGYPTEITMENLDGKNQIFSVPFTNKLENNFLLKLKSLRLINCKNIKFNSSNLISGTRLLETLELFGAVGIIGVNNFNYCYSLKKLALGKEITLFEGFNFEQCNLLENLIFENGFNANGLNVSPATLLSAETIVNCLEALADRTGQTAYTLTIGSTNRNKLTAEQIAIATNKNWNLA